MAKIVEYQEFLKIYKKTHSHLKTKRSAPPTTITNKLWNDLKKKHNCDQEKYRHHGGVKKYPAEFHKEAVQLINLWKLQYNHHIAKNKANLFGMMQNKKKTKKRKANQLLAENGTFNIALRPSKRVRVERIQKINDITQKQKKLMELAMNLASYKKLINLIKDGTLNELEKYSKSPEYKEFINISQSDQFEVLLCRLKGIAAKSNYASSIFYAIIYESKLFENHGFPVLQQIQSISEQYKYAKKLIKNEFLDLTQLIIRNKKNVFSMRDTERFRFIVQWLDVIFMTEFEDILKSKQLNVLQTNYKPNKKPIRTQTAIIDDINLINMQLGSLTYLASNAAKQKIKLLQQTKDKELKALDFRQKAVINQRNHRNRKDAQNEEIEEKYNVSIKRKVRGPRRIEDRPGSGHLVSLLEDIVNEYCLADPRRKTEVAIYIGTVPDIVVQLKAAGITLSKDSVRRRFKPTNKASNTALRYHTKTVNIQCQRVKNNGRKMHESARWNFQWRKNVKQLVSYLGASACFYIGVDDKDRIKLGSVIIIKAEKIVVAVDRPTTNDDHNFVAGSKYKLICSVNKAFELLDNCQGSAQCMTNRGKAMISLRSGIHDSSTAPVHGTDITKLLRSDGFAKYVRDDTNKTCPVGVAETDGGPDENVRFTKNVLVYLLIFIEEDLDTLIITMSVPGISALNSIERFMAFINDMLQGLFCDAFPFGNPLDSALKCKPDKVDLQLFNVEKCATDIVNNFIQHKQCDESIDAAYIKPPKDVHERDAQYFQRVFDLFGTVRDLKIFMMRHYQPSQFGGQFVKCEQRYGACSICKPIRSQYFNMNKASNNYPFLPTMVAMQHKDGTLQIVDPDLVNQLNPNKYHFSNYMESLNFNSRPSSPDLYNPFITKSMIKDRTCPKCNYYDISKKNIELHRKLKLCENIENKSDDIDIPESCSLIDCIEPTQEITEESYIIDHKQNHLFLMKYDEYTMEWITLHSNHEKVKNYLQSQASKQVNDNQDIINNDNDEQQTIFDRIKICDIPNFCHFDEMEGLETVEINKGVDVDPFDFHLSKYAENEKKEQEAMRKSVDIIYNDKIPPVQYKDGDKYYESDDNDSTDDDEPIVAQNKSKLDKKQRLEKVYELIPKLRNKKKSNKANK